MIQLKTYPAARKNLRLPHVASSSLLFKEDLELSLDKEDLEFIENVKADGVSTFSRDWAYTSNH